MRHLNVRWSQSWWPVRLKGTLECLHLPAQGEQEGKDLKSIQEVPFFAGPRVGQQHPLLASLGNLKWQCPPISCNKWASRFLILAMQMGSFSAPVHTAWISAPASSQISLTSKPLP